MAILPMAHPEEIPSLRITIVVDSKPSTLSLSVQSCWKWPGSGCLGQLRRGTPRRRRNAGSTGCRSPPPGRRSMTAPSPSTPSSSTPRAPAPPASWPTLLTRSWCAAQMLHCVPPLGSASALLNPALVCAEGSQNAGALLCSDCVASIQMHNHAANDNNAVSIRRLLALATYGAVLSLAKRQASC